MGDHPTDCAPAGARPGTWPAPDPTLPLSLGARKRPGPLSAVCLRTAVTFRLCAGGRIRQDRVLRVAMT
ncbi:UNVERIFIED_CONTAM: hypothetical protein RKD50_009027 [Streptomyces canus]